MEKLFTKKQIAENNTAEGRQKNRRTEESSY